MFYVKMRYNILGHANPSQIPGRPRLTNEEDDNEINNTISENGFQCSRQIRNELDLPCSERTVRRRLHERGYHTQIPAQKETLTINHKEQRLAFALEQHGRRNG